MDIYSQLFIEKGEITLEQLSKELTNVTSRLGEINGAIESLKYREQFYDTAIRDSKTARSNMKEKLKDLKSQILHYEQMVEKYRVVKTGSWFSWKLERIRIDDGERIAKENLDRLHQRINEVTMSLKARSIRNPFGEKRKVRQYLAVKEKEKNILENEYQPIKLQYDQVDQEFNVTINQLDQIFQSNEFTQNKATESVNQLYNVLRVASDILISICNKLNSSLKKIEHFPKSLVKAVLDAIKFIHIADQYNDSTIIDDIKHLLAL
ncbi:hypothetical protein I4U23_016415 [Adineta vaga]|nr:hypothetical protein I4U23_016415 [Adineta vaga]